MRERRRDRRRRRRKGHKVHQTEDIHYTAGITYDTLIQKEEKGGERGERGEEERGEGKRENNTANIPASKAGQSGEKETVVTGEGSS